jgi:hypothetical protein
MNDHEVFPGQYVVDNAPIVDIIDDIIGAVPSGSTRRVGVVRSMNSKDHTVNVSWFKRLYPDNLEVECDDTVSVYDVGRDPDRPVFYGDEVIRLLPDITGGTPVGKEKIAPADLSWVGHVVDLHDGYIQVKWGDCSTSMVMHASPYTCYFLCPQYKVF